MSNENYVVVFPSIFAENKISLLIANIKKILKIKNQNYSKISRDGNLILVDANDPVFASTTINLLFGIKQVIIAKKIKNDFATVVNEINKIGSSLLLKGEKFYVNVQGVPKGYVAKDVELSATSSLIEDNKKINARPGTEDKHDKLLFTYITKSNAYVSIFNDKGLGGTVNNSQNQKVVCGIFDEFSALACLETIKQGFEVKFVVFYQKQTELINLVKILQKILPRTLQTRFEVEFYNIFGFGNNLTSKNFLVAEVLSRIAIKEKISYVGLSVSPLVFPSAFIKKLKLKIFEFGLIPFIPLSGIGLEIFENAREIGFEKYLEKIERVLRTKIGEKHTKKLADTDIDNILENKKTSKVKIGPNILHEMLDTLQVKH
jgi:hypothetical protein|tara:strand:+ start:546 stop:1670 length:1125 start_codon:yes stop_codon:yes gene_type:complete